MSEKTQITFKGKIWKTGNSYVLTIPSDYVENEMIPKDTEIVCTVEVEA